MRNSTMLMARVAETIALGCSSRASQKTSICERPPATGHPGNGPNDSTKKIPATANIATRLCLSSASRIQYKSMPISSMFDKPNGSNPASPAIVPSNRAGFVMNGSAFDISAFKHTDERVDEYKGWLTNAKHGATKLNTNTFIVNFEFLEDN